MAYLGLFLLSPRYTGYTLNPTTFTLTITSPSLASMCLIHLYRLVSDFIPKSVCLKVFRLVLTSSCRPCINIYTRVIIIRPHIYDHCIYTIVVLSSYTP